MSKSPPPRRRRSSCSFDGFAQTRQQWQQRVSAIEEQKVVESRRRSSLSHLDFGKPVDLALPSPLRSEAVTMPPTPRKLSAASKEPFEGVPCSSSTDLNMHGLAHTADAADEQRLLTPGDLGTFEQAEDTDDDDADFSEQQLLDSQQLDVSQQQQQQQPSAAQSSATATAVEQQEQVESASQPKHDQQHPVGAASATVEQADHNAEQQHTNAILQSIEPSALTHQQLDTEADQIMQDSSEQQQHPPANADTAAAAAAAVAAVIAAATAAGAHEQQQFETLEQTAAQHAQEQQQIAAVDAAETDAVDTTAATDAEVSTEGDAATDSDDELFFDAVTAEPQQHVSAAASTAAATVTSAASSAQHSVASTTATATTQTVGQTVGQQRVTLPSPFFNFTLTEGGSQIVAECARLRAQVRAADARTGALQARLTAKEYVLQAVLQRSEEQQRMHAEQCW
jgi:hypothetical protein